MMMLNHAVCVYVLLPAGDVRCILSQLLWTSRRWRSHSRQGDEWLQSMHNCHGLTLYYAPSYSRKALSNAEICVCVSVCLSYAPSLTMVNFRAIVTKNTTIQRGCQASRSGQNSNKAVTGAVLEAFARWLHHKYAPVELRTAGGRHIVLLCDSWLINSWAVKVRNSTAHSYQTSLFHRFTDTNV